MNVHIYTRCLLMLFVYRGTEYVCTVYLFGQENLLYFQSHTTPWLNRNFEYVFWNKIIFKEQVLFYEIL